MQRAVDDVRRSYAVLGLRPGAQLGQVRRRYKALVKKWHPDRYAADPVGQAEAANRMREINVAYDLLMQRLGPTEVPHHFETRRSSRIPERDRLSREEIESIVRAIGSQGPVDTFLESVGWVGGTIRGVFAAVFVVACVARVAMLFFEGDFIGLLKDPGFLVLLLFLIMLLLGEYLERRKLERL